MENNHLLQGYNDMEKGAYLGAIASIATADHEATEDELEFMRELSAQADLSPQQTQAVERAAKEISGDELQRCLDILKTSELRFSLLADLVTFAQADGKYTEDEKENINKIAGYLNVTPKQFSLLDQFVQKTQQEATPEQTKQPGFLESLGLGDKFKDAGMNMNGLTKGLLGIVGPMLLARLVSGGLNRGRGGMGGLGGALGGALGGGMGRGLGGGGFGSLISMLSNGRGYRGLGGGGRRLLGF